jgi:hypothetical protein
MSRLVVARVTIAEGLAGSPSKVRKILVTKSRGIVGPEGVSGVLADFLASVRALKRCKYRRRGRVTLWDLRDPFLQI